MSISQCSTVTDCAVLASRNDNAPGGTSTRALTGFQNGLFQRHSRCATNTACSIGVAPAHCGHSRSSGLSIGTPIARRRWAAAGTPVCAATAAQAGPVMIADGAGGACVAWQDGRADGGDIYMQRLTAAGGVAAGWPAGGLAVCTATGMQRGLAITADGA